MNVGSPAAGSSGVLKKAWMMSIRPTCHFLLRDIVRPTLTASAGAVSEYRSPSLLDA